MEIIELREQAEARLFVAQGLWWQRIMPVRAGAVAEVLDWAFELASEGEPLPPVGFVADVGHMVFTTHTGFVAEGGQLPGWPPGLARSYEDYVLGKLFSDGTFERAGDALRQYKGKDRARGLAYLLSQMRHHCEFAGVLLSPAVLKTLRELNPQEVLTQGWEALQQDGPMPVLPHLYEQVIGRVRNTADVLGPEDVFELERGTALAQFSQRLALRQVLQAAAALAAGLPHQKPRTPARRYEVPTRIIEEDLYPVGGFSSISNRGTIESLLHSQLAYMEKDDRPDLFDMKYLRDELLYYSRDENQFLRRRRTFVLALFPDLAQARFKDAGLPYQRLVLLLAVLVCAVHKLVEWLSTESLTFAFVLVQDREPTPLTAERSLLEVLFSEHIANGVVTVEILAPEQLAERCTLAARRSLAHGLLASTHDQALEAEGAQLTRLVVDEQTPALGFGQDDLHRAEALPHAWDAWLATLEQCLVSWL